MKIDESGQSRIVNQVTSAASSKSRRRHAVCAPPAQPSTEQRSSAGQLTSILMLNSAAQSNDGGLSNSVAQRSIASVVQPSSRRRQIVIDDHSSDAPPAQLSPDYSKPVVVPKDDLLSSGELMTICDQLRELHRQRQMFHRTEKGLTLVIKDSCRRALRSLGKLPTGKKAAIAAVEALYKSIFSKKPSALAAEIFALTRAYISSRATFYDERMVIEKKMEALAEQLPVYPWIEATRGVGPLSLALIVGEVGNLSNFATVSKLWKYSGLAVINGRSQRKVAGAGATEQRYNPARRSVFWTIGSTLFRGQSENPKQKLKAGAYRVLYDTYKARKTAEITPVCMGCDGAGRVEMKSEDEADVDKLTRKKGKKPAKCNNCKGTGGPAPWGKTQKHRHTAASRYMEKCFMRDLWRAWRDSISAERQSLLETHSRRALSTDRSSTNFEDGDSQSSNAINV